MLAYITKIPEFWRTSKALRIDIKGLPLSVWNLLEYDVQAKMEARNYEKLSKNGTLLQLLSQHKSPDKSKRWLQRPFLLRQLLNVGHSFVDKHLQQVSKSKCSLAKVDQPGTNTHSVSTKRNVGFAEKFKKFKSFRKPACALYSTFSASTAYYITQKKQAMLLLYSTR